MAISTITSNSLTQNADLVVNGVTVGKGTGGVSNNTVVGSGALSANTTGTANTAIGYSAGSSNTTARANTFIGANAGATNTVGEGNTAIGGGVAGLCNGAMQSGTGSYNIAIGGSSLQNVSGNNNTAVGFASGTAAMSGGNNTLIGFNALASNTTASNNTAVGYQAGYSNQTGGSYTFVGYQCGYGQLNGSNSTALGYQALYSSGGPVNNTAVGNQALYSCTNSGDNNTALGHGAGYAITTGTYNIVLGSRDTTLTTGNYNLLIGRFANASAAGTSYAMVINSDNTARTDKGTSTGYMFPGGGAMYQGNNSASWSVTSDQRLKKNIVDNNTGLDIISKIQVRNFEYRLPEEVDPELKPTDAIEVKGVQLGVIAQEIAQVSEEFVKVESTGVMSVDPDNLTWYLINAVKELNAKVADLEAKLASK